MDKRHAPENSLLPPPSSSSSTRDDDDDDDDAKRESLRASLQRKKMKGEMKRKAVE